MKKTLTLLGVLIGTGVVAGRRSRAADALRDAGRGWGPGGGRMRMGAGRMKAELGLTDEQEAHSCARCI
jgi:hypothetical protein